MNIFDNIQDAAFAIVAQTFGYTATWEPANGGEMQTAQVCYKDPSAEEGLGEVDYQNPRHTIEYHVGDFNGLKESASKKNNESIKIIMQGVTFQAAVRKCETKFDGKTIIAYLNTPKPL
jgi:hypothetical protein